MPPKCLSSIGQQMRRRSGIGLVMPTMLATITSYVSQLEWGIQAMKSTSTNMATLWKRIANSANYELCFPIGVGNTSNEEYVDQYGDLVEKDSELSQLRVMFPNWSGEYKQ